MAKRRRSTLAGPNKRRRPSPSGGEVPEVDDNEVGEEQNGDAGADDDEEEEDEPEECPDCNKNDKPLKNEDKESWVECGACKVWYHWRCSGNGGVLESVDKWFCSKCIAENPKSRAITYKTASAASRKSNRNTLKVDYSQIENGIKRDPLRWSRILENKPMSTKTFNKMNGKDVNIDWLQSDPKAMTEPFIVESPLGLGMKMPDTNFTVSDVAELLGPTTPLEVIDVASQSGSSGWTLGKWAEYYNKAPETRDKILNVISLEISDTKLADSVLPPRLVRDLDWVERFWPPNKKGKGMPYPKVQLYCLMGVANAWTDWHVDFAGSSVYYHVLRGTKIFYFIRPTQNNLMAYERWSGSEIQNHSWLGDMVDEVIKVTLVAGNTMIIPTGWIHAVYTPEDSLVFGGNFLHSYNFSTQLKIREIENHTKVPKKFRFPHFTRLCWYAGEKYLRDIKAKEEFSPRVLESVEILANYLVGEARAIERGSDTHKREAREQVPADKIKDAPAVARELRWRVKQVLGVTSDDENAGNKTVKSRAKGSNLSKEASQPNSHFNGASSKFRNFEPLPWDAIQEKQWTDDKKALKAPKPDEASEWKTPWMEWNAIEDTKNGEEVIVKRKQATIVKVRRTTAGIERQRVERIFEEWDWSDTATAVESSLKSESATTD